MLRFYGFTDFIPLFRKYTHRRYALNRCIRITCLPFAYPSRVTGSLTRMFPFPFHMSSYSYRYGLSTRLWLPFCLTLIPFWLVDSSAESLFPDSCLPSLLWLFVLVSTDLIYIRLGMRTRSSSSIYFATTLQVWLARSHVLSLVPSSSLAKATALRPEEGVHSLSSVKLLTGSEVQPTRVLRCARNNKSLSTVVSMYSWILVWSQQCRIVSADTASQAALAIVIPSSKLSL